MQIEQLQNKHLQPSPQLRKASWWQIFLEWWIQLVADPLTVDTECSGVGFFGKEKKKTHSGHPRNYGASLVGVSDSRGLRVFRPPAGLEEIFSALSFVFHNSGFDMLTLRRAFNLPLRFFKDKVVIDTRVLSKLSSSEPEESHGLKELTKKLTGVTPKKFSEVTGSELELIEYLKDDVRNTKFLHSVLKQKIDEQGLGHLAAIECEFTKVNFECESVGVPFDLRECESFETKIASQIEMLNTDLAEVATKPTNWNSPKQVREQIYSAWRNPIVIHRDKVTTNKAALAKLAINSEKVGKLKKLRELESVRRDIKKLRSFVDPASGRIHLYCDTLGTDTGRATSKNPNLQGVGKEGGIRSLFVAPPDKALVCFDYSRIEPRVLAHFCPQSEFYRLAADPTKDIYEELALKISERSGIKSGRDQAKIVLLATMYGMREKSLSTILKCTETEAKLKLDAFWSGYPEVENFRARVLDEARINGFARGILGRRRWLPDIKSEVEYLRQKAERQAFNAVIQGSAATVFKSKLVELYHKLPEDWHILLHVHDEVLLEVPQSDAPKAFEFVRGILEGPVPWFLPPLKVEGGYGRTWADAKLKGKVN